MGRLKSNAVSSSVLVKCVVSSVEAIVMEGGTVPMQYCGFSHLMARLVSIAILRTCSRPCFLLLPPHCSDWKKEHRFVISLCIRTVQRASSLSGQNVGIYR